MGSTDASSFFKVSIKKLAHFIRIINLLIMKKTGLYKKCLICGKGKYFSGWQILKNKTGKFFCGNEHRYFSEKGKSIPNKTREKMSLSHKGKLKTGGIYFNGLGYKMVFKPEHPNSTKAGYVREHRLVMEKHLKRYLNTGEVVHHINEDKKDNRISNLMLFSSHSEHMTKHKNAKKLLVNK